MVFRLKEVICTALFILIAILLIFFLILMCFPKNEGDTTEEYTSGTYTASLVLNSVPMEVCVLIDGEHIKGIELLHLSDTVNVLYPLLEPSLAEIEQSLISHQSLDFVSFEKDNTYTGMVLRDAVYLALMKAKK